MTNDESTTQLRHIAASRLEKSPLNARRTAGSAGLDELKASILAHGLMQNLVVTEDSDGMFHVIAGGRRLEAIRSLQAEGRLPQDFAVPCQVVTEASALEMSLAENTVRLAMHPADQFEAFAALIDQGHSATDVAGRFGIEESLVQKRMKLARVHPTLLQEYRNEALTLECLMAFAVTDDHCRQLKVYESLQHWQKDDPGAIRDALTETMIEASSKLARFVGLDAYLTAGGPTRNDLFGEEIYLEEPDLLNRLAEEKLDGIRRELEAEGWGWIEINPERDYNLIYGCKRLCPQLIDAPSELLDLKARLDAELEDIEQMLEDAESDELLDRQQAVRDQLEEVVEKLAAYIGFDTEQKALAGCFVSIGQDGTPFFEKGLVKPEHRKQLARLLDADGDDGQPDKVKPKNPMPESLRRDLAVYRLQIAQVELVKHPAIAFDLLVFQVASAMLDQPAADDGADVQFRRPRLNPPAVIESTAAAASLAAIARSLPTEWLTRESALARFEAFRLLPDAAKLELLAYCVAMALKPKLAPGAGEKVTAYDAALALTDASVADYWRPASDNFLRRISRDQLLAIGRETLGEAWSQSRWKDKKASLVDQLHRAFSDPEKSGRMPDQIERLKTWLPAGMAFRVPPAPEAAAASDEKTAA
ncbi:MAG TPA: ParB/Srx family N-terminal domain-containing protein [Gemmatales bacterium]|nr:ParB/Srx family N-terminal domain-containing protein [Gemmatales bacterium]